MKQPAEKDYRVAIYCRLSREDENDSESVSIGSQKMLIGKYCEEHKLHNIIEYIDDGFSGVSFNRPAFQRMLADIESGKINFVITKDLSRLGRDYIMTGYYTEIYFPEHGVRYVAINDSFDTSKGRNEIAPFKNLLNDMYAADCSSKIRAVLTQKKANGEHIAGVPPLGYKFDPHRKNHLVIDEETAPVIRLIFDMYKKGAGSTEIRNYLTAHKIMKPSAWLHSRNPNAFHWMGFDEDEDTRYIWCNDMVSRILKNETYIGNSINYRDHKPNHKSKMKRQPKDQWMIVPNTHEAIIDMDTWDVVQSRLGIHKKPEKKYENIFLGIAICPDCGTRMRATIRHDKKYKEQDRLIRFLSCARYGKYGTKACAMHSVNYDALSEIVRGCINECIQTVQIDEQRMLELLLKQKNADGDVRRTQGENRLKVLHKRDTDIDTIIAKLYEDRALGVVPENTSISLLTKYTAEKQSIAKEIELIGEQVSEQEKTVQDIHKFIGLIKGYTYIETLNAEILNTLIEKIYIHQSSGLGSNRKQQIDIFFRFVGQIKNVP